MASKACATCLRTLERSSVRRPQKTSSTPLTSRPRRTFTTRAAALYSDSRSKVTGTPPAEILLEETKTSEPKKQTSQQIPLTLKAAAEFQKVAGVAATQTYTAYGATESMYKECARPADYSIPQAADKDAEIPKTDNGEDLGVGGGWWHDASSSNTWQQHLLDHFFYDAENKMSLYHDITMRGVRNKYLKDLFVQWRGVLAAYDEGIIKGDAHLAAAVWRNVFKAEENTDFTAVAAIVGYIRRVLKALDAMSDEEFVTAGKVAFGTPASESELVAQRSKMMRVSFPESLEWKQ